MKRNTRAWVLMAVLGAALTAAHGDGTHVEVRTEDLLSRALPRARVTLTPQFAEADHGAALVNVDAVALVTDSAGTVTFSNVIAGTYKLQIAGTPGTGYRITVPTNSGTFSAVTLRTTTNTVATVPQALTVTAGDARYALKGETAGSAGITNNETRSVVIAGAGVTNGSITLSGALNVGAVAPIGWRGLVRMVSSGSNAWTLQAADFSELLGVSGGSLRVPQNFTNAGFASFSNGSVLVENGSLKVIGDIQASQGITAASASVNSNLAVGSNATVGGNVTAKGVIFDLLSPPGAPDVSVNAGAGNLDGTYNYRVSFVSARGDTEPGTVSSGVTPASQQVDLSAIPTGPAGVTARKIWRVKGGSMGTVQLVTTLNDNTTTTYTDNIADGSVTEYPQAWNATGGLQIGPATTTVRVDSYGIAVGPNAGQSNAGYANIYFGRDSGKAATIGYANTMFGDSTYMGKATGSMNSGFGQGALAMLAAGEYNNAFGFHALAYLTNGSHNNAFGDNAAGRLSNGAYNLALGENAMSQNVAGNYNVVGGHNAMLGASGQSASGNTAFGYSSGMGLRTGGYNALYGAGAGQNLTTGHSNIFLGPYVEAATTNDSNMVNIGNIIYAEGVKSGSNFNTQAAVRLPMVRLEAMRVERNSVGSTVAPVIVLTNGAPATTGNQEYSPSIMLHGQGYRTGTGISVPVSVGLNAVPVQGTSSNPKVRLNFVGSVSNATPASIGYIDSGGEMFVTSLLAYSSVEATATTGLLGWQTRTHMAGPVDGVWILQKYDGTCLVSQTNGVLIPSAALGLQQRDSLPTNSIPVSSTSASVTNWFRVNLKGKLYDVATNYVAGGWMYIPAGAIQFTP